MACMHVRLSVCVIDRCRPHDCYYFRCGCRFLSFVFCLCGCLFVLSDHDIASTHLCTRVRVAMCPYVCVCVCVCVYGLGPDGNRLAVALPAYTSRAPTYLSLYSPHLLAYLHRLTRLAAVS